MVEFLNEQMDPAEVLAFELKQFVIGETITLIPRTLGKTSRAEQQKDRASMRSKMPWNKSTLLEEVTRILPKAEANQAIEVVEDLIAWAGSHPELRLEYATTAKWGFCQAVRRTREDSCRRAP